jgi:hypothetical protein
LLEHLLCRDQLIVEDLTRNIEQAKDRRISHAIEDGRAFFSTLHNATVAQHRKLLRDGRLIASQERLEFIHAALAVPEMIEDGEPHRMPQRFEEFRFEAANRIIHIEVLWC